MSTRSTPPAIQSTPSYTGPFITVAVLFFIFGFITNLNMALVPHLRSIFDLPYAWAMLAESAFFLAYFVFSSPTSKLIESIGYKKTMVVSLFIQVVGCLLFVPAASMVSFPLFLTAVFIVGAGVTALQTAANPYVAILGPEHSAPVRLTLAQASEFPGGHDRAAGCRRVHPHGPCVDGLESRDRQHGARALHRDCRRIVDPGLRGGVYASAAHCADAVVPPCKRRRSDSEPQHLGLQTHGAGRGGHLPVCRRRSGTGVDRGELLQEPRRGQRQDGLVPGVAVLGWRAGRPPARSWVLTKVKSNKLLGAFGFIAAALLRGLDGQHGPGCDLDGGAVRLLQLHHVPEHLCAWDRGLGPMTSKGSGLIMTAVVGGAIVPLLLGAAADKMGIQHAFVIPIFCYLFIAYYGLWGSKPTRTVTA